MNSLQEIAHGLSIGYGPDDVTWPDNVIMVTSWFFFKSFFSGNSWQELDDTWTQCSPIWCVYMVLEDSWSGSYDVTDDVIT